ncbi:MAG: 23S rRNA (pseudouridine(1915)-N(3))-methyltransferase RlmH [Caldisericota bacterium]|jgi:23S rRNA (pseudouridine1915-N3)-methyltransferase|nr:23S rRNA (pseudouridine(1915)-N(3))-methyltransferase RlmH [Caldisericota bacterium]
MKIMVCAQGAGLKKPYTKMAQDEYARRLTHYCEVSIVDVASRQLATYARFEEGVRVLLDPRGQELASHELAERLQDLMNMGTKKLSFFIGGPEGFNPLLQGYVQQNLTVRPLSPGPSVLSFGRLTLPHEFVRIILLEQLYRAFTILKGEPYDK